MTLYESFLMKIKVKVIERSYSSIPKYWGWMRLISFSFW